MQCVFTRFIEANTGLYWLTISGSFIKVKCLVFSFSWEEQLMWYAFCGRRTSVICSSSNISSSFFNNRLAPYMRWQLLTQEQGGYCCLIKMFTRQIAAGFIRYFSFANRENCHQRYLALIHVSVGRVAFKWKICKGEKSKA